MTTKRPEPSDFVQRILSDIRKRTAAKPVPATPTPQRAPTPQPKATYTPPPQPFDPDDGYVATGKGLGEATARIGQTVASTTGGIATIAVQRVIPGKQEIERKFDRSGALADFGGSARRAYESSKLPTGVKGAIELAADPLNLIGLGPTGKGIGAVGRVAANPRSTLGRAVRMPAYATMGETGTPSVPARRVPTPSPPKQPPAIGSGITTTVKQRPTSWFKLEPFEAPGDRLVGPATHFETVAGRTQVLRQIYNVIDPAAIHYGEDAANLGIKKRVYEEIQKARAHAAVMDWWAQAKPTFGFDAKGVATKVKLAPGAGAIQSPIRSTIMDIVENPLRYDLTPDQQDVLDKAIALMDSVLASEKAAGVQVNELADYWARIVTSDPKKQQTLLGRLKETTSGPTMPGSKGHTKARTFDFAEDTVNAGFTINTDPVQTLTNRLDAGIQAVSNREATLRARQLPGVHFGAPAFGEGQLLSQFNPNAIQTWSAPRETVQEIQKWIDLPEFSKPSGNRLAQEVLQAYRQVITSLDLGSATLQTGRTAWRNPAAWTRAVAGGTQALFREPVSYFSANRNIIDRGIQNGAITPPTEFLFPARGLAKNVAGSTITRDISLGNAYNVPSALLRASNRFMQWNIFVAQTELYKAAEGLGGKGIDELVSLGKTIRHQTGTESYATLGIRGTQRDLEAIALFAPRFVRAIGNELAQAFTGGPGGAEARRSLGTALAGMTALTVGANYAQGRRTNLADPRQEDWARFKVGDSWVSAYGPLHNYFRTLARIGYYSTQGDVSLGGEANPDPGKALREIGRFAQSKEGIALGLLSIGGEIAFTGESSNFDGEIINYNPVTWRHALNWPITTENVMKGLAEDRAESLLNIANVNINPESPGYTWRQHVEAETGTPHDLLDWETRRYYRVQDETGRALYKEHKARFESSKTDYGAAQEIKELFLRERLDQGLPVSVMRDDLDFLRDSFVKPNRVKDPAVRQVFTEFLVAADYVESTGFWDLVKQVPNYNIPNWQQDYEQWKSLRGIPETAMGMSPAQLGHAKVIDAELDKLEKKALRADPALEQYLVTFYDRKGASPAGIMLRIRLHEQRAEAVRRAIETEVTKK